eukprot:TRINITY_DN983_c0_g1_i1.p4 TRINITY_DN983_c0_g1~~TRINITY_DN983_c0_g1_i1.p4  ORF type:complete len:120 (-),score=17.06 TRINITY_DN983_c0_g1_i1:479-838(-)
MGSKKQIKPKNMDGNINQLKLQQKQIQKNSTKQKHKVKMKEDDINNIFKTAIKQQQYCNKQTKQKNKEQGSKDDIFGEQRSSDKKITEEGYAVYTEAELGFRDDCGDTDLCPFDCHCCF